MKISEALKVIDEGWVRKPKGFRVHYLKKVDGQWVAEYAPNPDDKPMDSDVAAWRLAWKFSQVRTSEDPDVKDFVNIYVVDDSDNQVKYYGTNRLEVLNPLEIQDVDS